MPTTAEMAATIMTKLNTVITANPATYVDYKIGDKSVSKSQYVKHLQMILKTLRENPDASISMMRFDHIVTEEGRDLTEYTD